MHNPPRILVVDDEPLVLEAVCRLLQRDGLEVERAETGQICLEQARRHRPDLILLDVMLPDINGVEVLRRLKAEPELSDIFVVHLSAQRGSVERKMEGLESGADGYIEQPVENRELLARVHAFLRHKKTIDELRESEARYRVLFESNPQPMWIVEKGTWSFLAANRSALHHYGYGRTGLPKTSLRELLAPGQDEALQAAGESTSYYGTWTHRKSDGSLIEVETSEHDLSWNGRNARAILVQDVTERNRMEKEKSAQLESFAREIQSLRKLSAGKREESLLDSPLQERLPASYAEFLTRYDRLLNAAVETRIYKTDQDASAQVAQLAGDLCGTKSSARDVIQLHHATLRKLVPSPEAPKAQAYIEIGRITLLELLSRLLGAYRMESIGSKDGESNIKNT